MTASSNGDGSSKGTEQTLAHLCGAEVARSDYVGYFLNEHGEELVFVQRPGETTGTLWHSDADWEPQQVSDHSIKIGVPFEGVITVEGLIVDRPEATWLSACLASSRHLRRN